MIFGGNFGYIVVKEIGEKFSFYGKDIYVFQAVLEDKNSVVAQSKQFVVTGYDYQGPSNKNKHHITPFNDMITSLKRFDWVEDGSYGDKWYEIKFQREIEEENEHN